MKYDMGHSASLQFYVGIPRIFQTMNHVSSNNLSLKCQWFTPSGWKDIGIRVCGKD